MAEDTINAGNYTPITQGLREYVRMHPVLKHTGLSDFLDNIDAVHKALETENAKLRKKQKEWSIGATEAMAFVDRLSDAAAKREEVTILGVDYAALPLDADGVPIHVGDDMQSVIEPASHGTVYRMELRRDGWWIYFSSVDTRPTKCRHHHEPTVEDVLREMADRCYADEDEPRDRDAIVAEYAAKLRLAGDAE